MYDLNITEKLSDIDDRAEYSLLPDGEYYCVVKDAPVKTTKNGTGKYLAIKYQIETVDFEGRYLFQNINFQNESVQAQNIGKAQIKQLTLACGLPEIPAQSTDFIGRSVKVLVGTKEGRNEVKKVSSILGSTSQATAPKTNNTPW